MSEDRLPLYCAHNVLLLWQHGGMTRIPAQVVYSYKCFNGNIFESYIVNAKHSNKSGKVQESPKKVQETVTTVTDYRNSC